MPSITSRDYAGPQDLRAMQRLVQVTWTRNSHLHVGDLVWQRYPRCAWVEWPTRLWFDGDEIVAWCWVWSPADAVDDEDGFYAIVRPSHALLYDTLFDWAETANPHPQLAVIAYEHDAPLVAALTRRGYRTRDHGPFGLHSFRTLDAIPEPSLP